MSSITCDIPPPRQSASAGATMRTVMYQSRIENSVSVLLNNAIYTVLISMVM